MAEATDPFAPASRNNPLLYAASGAVRSLLNAPVWETALAGSLEQLGRAVDASRCFVFKVVRRDEGGILLRRHTEWECPTLPPKAVTPDSILLPFDETGRVHGQELLWRSSVVSALTDFSPAIRTFLESRSVLSLAVVPITVSGEWCGCIGFDDCLNERDWTPIELESLHLVSDAIASAIEREQLVRQRVQAAAIVNHSDDAIISKTLEGVITDWNRSAERIYGYTAEEAIGQKITLIIPSERSDEFDSIMSRLRNGEQVDHYETIRVRKDGRRIDVSVSISPVMDGLGEISGAVTIARDITDRKQAEEAMAASEERLRLALDAGNVGAWDWHIEMDQVIWSSNMEDLHGLEPGSFGGTFDDYNLGIHPGDHEQVANALQRALAGEEDYHVEYRSLRPDGSFQWLATHGRVIFDEPGRPIRMAGICYDITERKRAEHLQVDLMARIQHAHAEADAERSRLRELFHHAPAMMALLEGPDHVFTLANDHYLQAVGYRDVVGKPAVDALPEVKDQGLIALLDEVYKTGGTIVRAELPVQIDVRGDGILDQRWFSFAYQPSQGPDGNVTGVLVHAVDLTDHVRARQRVEELAAESSSQRDRLQQVIDVMPEGVSITDATGQFVLANSAALRIWGQPPPQGDYRQYSVFECYYPDGSPYAIEDLPLSKSLLRDEIVLMEQLEIRNAQTGILTPVLVNSAPLHDRDGSITGAVAVFQDIRGIKEFEQQKDEFLQTVSHDLKNPLTTIVGYAQMMRRTTDRSPERYESAIGNMETAAKRAIVLLDEILDLTRLQMGRQLELTTDSVDLISLATRLTEQHRATTSKHQVLIESELENLVGEWDETRLERVIDNLLANAILYSPDGGRVVVRLSRERHAGRSVAEVSVADEGMGVPEKDLPRLFERFWRGSNVRDQIRGTGLGLSGVKAIVEAHGGEVSVESVEGQGSTFTIRLPITGLTTTDIE